MLDCVVSEALRSPTSWELAQYASAPKADRNDWAEAFDLAYSLRWDEAMLQASEARAGDRLFRRMTTRPNTFRGLFRKGPGAGEGDSWFDANYYVVDGVSGKVSDFVDYIDNTHTLRQATSAQQVAVPSADAVLGGALSANFVAVSSNRYDSTRAPSAWTYLHAGVGSEVVVSFVPNTNPASYLVCTEPGTATTQAGFIAYWSSGGSARCFVGTGAATVFDTGAVGSGTMPVGVGTYMSVSYLEGRTPSEVVVSARSAAIYSSNSAVNPSSVDPSATLRLGSGTTGTAATNARVRGLYTFRRVLSAAHRTIVQQWIQRETGIAP